MRETFSFGDSFHKTTPFPSWRGEIPTMNKQKCDNWFNRACFDLFRSFLSFFRAISVPENYHYAKDVGRREQNAQFKELEINRSLSGYLCSLESSLNNMSHPHPGWLDFHKWCMGSLSGPFRVALEAESRLNIYFPDWQHKKVGLACDCRKRVWRRAGCVISAAPWERCPPKQEKNFNKDLLARSVRLWWKSAIKSTRKLQSDCVWMSLCVCVWKERLHSWRQKPT